MSKRKRKRGSPKSALKPVSGGEQHEVASENGIAPKPMRSRYLDYVYYVAVFASAFLLFQVQPLISKAILPWFGGSPAVWTTCMLFFQVLLLLGYAVAHAANRSLTAKQQLIGYGLLMVVSLFMLPILPDLVWKPSGEEASPTWLILRLLLFSLGLQFLVLSMNSPLIQVWFHRYSGEAPYKLYSISNAGSLLGLLTYPFLIEPNLATNGQSVVWSVGYAILGLMMFGCCFVASRADSTVHEEWLHDEGKDRLIWTEVVWWLVLSACGSVLLLAMTNHITQNVAVVPFLWVVPLAVYLISFILVFAQRPLYHRGIFIGAMMLSLFGCAWLYHHDSVDSIALSMSMHLLGLFSGCMLCHGELSRRKPCARHLTAFYLAMSAGGAMGGVFVSLIAPTIFLDYYEYPLILTACWLISFAVLHQGAHSPIRHGKPIWAWGLLACFFILFLMQIRDGVIRAAVTNILTHRDFYGVLSVRAGQVDGLTSISLSHGSTLHGTQNIDEELQFEPTAYYTKEGGLGAVMSHLAGRPDKRVGVLGMGIATIAAYAETGDTFRFYEIDPNVIRIAQDSEIFTFWSLFESRGAKADVVLGDARISLERELARGEPQGFDALILDVFTGDAVPAHLLTTQAMDLYKKHLVTDGILAIHISNRHLDLLPVVKSLGDRAGMRSAIVIVKDTSEWVVLANAKTLNEVKQRHGDNMFFVRDDGPQVLWTDGFSNLLKILK